MQSKSLKFASMALSVVMLFAALTASAFSASASSFSNSYSNTGAGASDIVGVAKTQVGYVEEDSSCNWTKYGQWYGLQDEWCAMFVSWCANQAGVSTSVIPKFAGCTTGMGQFKDMGVFHYSPAYDGSYTPKAGDLIFFGYSSTSSYHVGIVEYVSGGYVHTIEGNTWSSSSNYQDAVLRCSYSTSASKIIGYASPKYAGKSSSSSTTNTTTVTTVSSGETWVINSSDGVYLRSGAGTSYSRLGGIPYRGKIVVDKKVSAGGYTWGHTTYNGVTGWCVLDYATYISGKISVNSSSSTSSTAGDVNGNGVVDSADAMAVQKFITNDISLTAAQQRRADANGDGKVTSADARVIQKKVLS